jgi:molybdopterin molybdotransferase
MQGLPARAPVTRRARLGADVGPTGPRTHYMRARLSEDGAVITPFDRQDSALLSILSGADALLIRPLGDGARQAGEMTDYLPL